MHRNRYPVIVHTRSPRMAVCPHTVILINFLTIPKYNCERNWQEPNHENSFKYISKFSINLHTNVRGTISYWYWYVIYIIYILNEYIYYYSYNILFVKRAENSTFYLIDIQICYLYFFFNFAFRHFVAKKR